MLDSSAIGRLSDMVQAKERLQSLIERITIAALGHEWQRQWLVERGVEIISEASRHLPNALKARHPTVCFAPNYGHLAREPHRSDADVAAVYPNVRDGWFCGRPVSGSPTLGSDTRPTARLGR